MIKATLAIAWLACTAHAWVSPSQFNRSKSTQLDASIRSGFKRFKDSITSEERSRDELKIGIAGFYDRSSKLWEEVWGEHMHQYVNNTP